MLRHLQVPAHGGISSARQVQPSLPRSLSHGIGSSTPTEMSPVLHDSLSPATSPALPTATSTALPRRLSHGLRSDCLSPTQKSHAIRSPDLSSTPNKHCNSNDPMSQLERGGGPACDIVGKPRPWCPQLSRFTSSDSTFTSALPASTPSDCRGSSPMRESLTNSARPSSACHSSKPEDRYPALAGRRVILLRTRDRYSEPGQPCLHTEQTAHPDTPTPFQQSTFHAANPHYTSSEDTTEPTTRTQQDASPWN